MVGARSRRGRTAMKSCTVIMAAMLVLGLGSSASAIKVDPSLAGSSSTVGARDAAAERDDDVRRRPDSKERLTDWMESPWCGQAGDGPNPTWWVYPCANGDTPPQLDCGDDAPRPPLWRRTRETPEDGWSEWQLRSGWYCTVDLLPELSAAAFKVLPIPPSPLTVQPDRGWVLVNKETIAYSSDKEQTLRTEVLGVGVTVVVKPVSFTWDFGDGRPFTTEGPGRAYPDQDVSRVFRELGTERVRLTTTWSGRYQVAGDSRWREVDGTATTTSASQPFEVVERRSVLVGRD
jgi:hypothetical protein